MARNPTRMNLINAKKSIKLAQKGHDLLKRKREALVIEFFKMLKESKTGRQQLQIALEGAYKSTIIASTFAGDFELEQEGVYVKDSSNVSMGVKNVMGVRIPEIEKAYEEASFNPFQASLAVSDVGDSFTQVKGYVIETAKREQSLRRLILEIDKVKRRVNALEYIVVPRLRKETAYIAFRLDEMERDMFSALKHVKKKLERQRN